jgi:flagellar motor switch/type III secretory pathway protein FliN
MYWDGRLWGALGYAFIFGLAGLGASLFRREAFDPRQTPFGGSSSWPMIRAVMGLYYGFTLGFYVGILLIAAVGRFQDLPGLDMLARAFGALPDPNLAFATGLGASGWWLAASALVLGRPDLTMRFTDPPAPEREPDLKVEIPPLPKVRTPDLDMSSVRFETDQMAQQFQQQLAALARELGLNEEVAPASTLVMGTPASADEATSSMASSLPVANVISARKPDFDVAFDSAMGQLSNVYVQVSAQLGLTELPLTEWMTLAEGAVLEVPRSPDNLVSLCINGRPVGRARAVVLEDHKAIQVLSLSPDATQQLGR